MAYKAKISQTANGIKETKSVLFIETILVEKAKTDIVRDNTQANIDGYIELYDAEKRPCGKITVQVKTVNKRDEGKNKYPCPTSLFAYAETHPDIVFLLAVDHSQNKVLFKYISYKLLNENRDKENQDSITLYFTSDEELKSDNVDKVVSLWKCMCEDKVKFLDTAFAIKEENDALKEKLHSISENVTTLSVNDIQELQSFSDYYNNLLNNDFRYIKQLLFPDTWKRGIAIYSYSENSLEYSLFNIKMGELLPLIRQLPTCSIMRTERRHDYASFSCVDNALKQDPKYYAIYLLKKHIDTFIKSKRIIPFDETFLIEYIYDFANANFRRLNVPKSAILNVDTLLQFFHAKYPEIDKMPICVVGGSNIYLNTIYEALNCLSRMGYKDIPYPYPQKNRFAGSGLISDFYSNETALEKSRQVISATYRAYQMFIQKEFPLLSESLDLFYGGNLITILLDYSSVKGCAIFYVYYFKSVEPYAEKIVTIEDINSSEIVKENAIVSYHDLHTKNLIRFREKSYKLLRYAVFNDTTIIFGKCNCLNFFYNLLQEHFQEYFSCTLKHDGLE